ncbi:MAG: L-seryl-tRNA(Sec) selenium transferase [Eubacteriales bacterium]|nr:L-seryl-tRNA(Sec) selenium transferase [Eubacteriales bacterium]
MQSSELSRIPKVDDVLALRAVEAKCEAGFRDSVVAAVRAELASIREGLLSGALQEAPSVGRIEAAVLARVERNGENALKRVVNATGIVLHTNFGRAPLPKAAVEAVNSVAAGYSNLEYSLCDRQRGSRDDHVSKLVAELTGAEDALVVNNNASAVLLALAALAKAKEVLLSRGELVEIGGCFRVPEVMEQSGCILKEVGTTNRTRLADYARALSPACGALLKVHTSNFKMTGFVESASVEELSSLAKDAGLPLIHDLGSGVLNRRIKTLVPMLAQHDEPTLEDSLTGGADVVCFSGDKLLGAAQAGIIAGKKAYIDVMRKHPLLRAMRVDKMTLAALEATLRLYRDPARAMKEIPALHMLSASALEVKEKAERLLRLFSLGDAATLELTETAVQAGGGSVPGGETKSYAVAVGPKDISVDELDRRLHAQKLPVVGRISKERLLLEARTLFEEDLEPVALALAFALEVRP